MKRIWFAALSGALTAPLFQAHPSVPAGDPPGNVLILLADDLGVDQLATYTTDDDLAHTPVIDALAQEGVLFRNAWTNPICSPTRASLMTGRHAFQTTVGSGIEPGEPGLPLEELILPEMLDAGSSSYAHAAFGKWHLGNEELGGVLAPNVAGWSHFDGTIENLVAPQTYGSWTQVVNGESLPVDEYATTATVDAVLEWTQATAEPWLAYVAFHAPHAPWHEPPAELHTVDLSQAPPPSEDPSLYYRAMVEALDTEIGRLLEGLGDARANTTVVFLGDNGTPADVIPGAEPKKYKGSVFEGGVHVPLIVTSPLVAAPGTEAAGLVSATDLFATVAEIAGVDLEQPDLLPAPVDSVSLVPYLADPAQPSLREWMFTEAFKPNAPFGEEPEEKFQRAVRDERYKLIVDGAAPHRLFDLSVDPTEQSNLLEGTLTADEQAAYLSLVGHLFDLVPMTAAQLTPYGCGVNPSGSLVLTSGLPSVGATVTLGVDNPLGTQSPGSMPSLVISRQAHADFPCGGLFARWGMSGAGAAGELLIDLQVLVAILPGPAWEGPGSPAPISFQLPADPSFVGFTFYVQGTLLDPTPGAPIPNALTEALEIQVGV